MVLDLAYTADSHGDPVPWNETHWVDSEFSTLLSQAQGTLDVKARRLLFCQLEKIQMERGSIGVAFWKNTWLVYRDVVQGIAALPGGLLWMNEAWKGSRVYVPGRASAPQAFSCDALALGCEGRGVRLSLRRFGTFARIDVTGDQPSPARQAVGRERSGRRTKVPVAWPTRRPAPS